jgi:hypothetical protein
VPQTFETIQHSLSGSVNRVKREIFSGTEEYVQKHSAMLEVASSGHRREEKTSTIAEKYFPNLTNLLLDAALALFSINQPNDHDMSIGRGCRDGRV